MDAKRPAYSMTPAELKDLFAAYVDLCQGWVDPQSLLKTKPADWTLYNWAWCTWICDLRKYWRHKRRDGLVAINREKAATFTGRVSSQACVPWQLIMMDKSK